MSINEIIIYLMVLFMVLGAVDRILGNRFGLGEKFEEGIMNMGALALSMIGIICLAPVLADVLRPVVVPVYQFLGADPAMFVGTILANDMGGAPLAKELALTEEAGQLAASSWAPCWGPPLCSPFLWAWASSKRRTGRLWPPACWRAWSPSLLAPWWAAWWPGLASAWCCAT